MHNVALWQVTKKSYNTTIETYCLQCSGDGHGTFYEYYRSRRDILIALTEPVNNNGRRAPQLRSQSLRDRIRSEIHWYLADHVEHLELSKVWHNAIHVDAEIAETRRRERRRRVERVRRGIQSAGMEDGVDPEIAAAALNAMLEEF